MSSDPLAELEPALLQLKQSMGRTLPVEINSARDGEPQRPTDPSEDPSDPADPANPAEDPARRDQALRKELAELRQVNSVIEGVIDAVAKSHGNLQVMLEAARTTDSLLNQWTLILSQSVHTSHLLGSRDWQGAAKDNEIYEARMAELRHQEEMAEAERLRRQAEEEAQRQRQQELQEKKRQREAVLQRRVYGRRGGAAPVARGARNDATVASKARAARPTASGKRGAAAARSMGPPSGIPQPRRLNGS